MNPQMLAKLALVEKHFTSKEFQPIVMAARTAYRLGLEGKFNTEMRKLPTAEQLLDRLIEKLKGKSVYKTLKAIQEGKAASDPIVTMTGLSSLLTHVLIEMKQGHREYGILIPTIFEKMGVMIYSL